MSSNPFDTSSPIPEKGNKLDETSGLDAVPASDQTSASGSQKFAHASGSDPNSQASGSPSNVPASDETSAFNTRTRRPKGDGKSKKANVSSIGGYEIGEMLGQGGMGRVFRADDSSGRSVALKLLSPDLARSSEALARFKQEGLIASQINHPHCVFVHRVDEDSGTPFIAMELMTGLTLKDLVQKKGPLPYSEAVRLILQCMDGLIEAHSLGMIHRDIKPANCYLDDDGNVKVGDFGLARSLVSDSELTQTGAFLGTPLFASPEQLLGQSIDARSDIYSLTATFYYLLAGKAPFESPHAAQVIARIASTDPPKFKEAGVEVPEAIEKIVMKGLSRDAAKRYTTFAEMRNELQATIEPKMQTTTLPRRFFAWILDYFVMTAMISVVMFTFFRLKELQNNQLWSQLVGTIVVLVYYIFSESIFSASLGKAALRVTVVDAKTGGRPGFAKVLVRALVANALSGVLVLASRLLFQKIPPQVDLIWITFVTFLNTSMLCSTWWSTKKRQLFHDWLSGTECRTRVGARAAIRSAISLPQWSVPIETNVSAATLRPKSLGRFGITGEIRTREKAQGTKWLIGQDKQLDRDVWIACLDDKSIEYEDAQTSKPKSLRLRFIEEGEENDFRWFAYVAPESVPMTLCLTSGVSFPWPVTRSILGDIADSVESAPTPEVFLDANRTWVDASGRLSLVDFTCSDRQDPDLLPLVAKLGLPARHRLRRTVTSKLPSSMTLPIEALAPARATRLLESLATNATTNTSLFSYSVLKKNLEDTDKKTHELTPSIRFVASAASLGLISPLLFFAVIMMAMPAILIISDSIYKEIRKLKSLSVYAESPDRFSEYWSLVSGDERTRWSDPANRSAIQGATELQTDRLRTALHSVGSFENMILANIPKGIASLENPPVYGSKRIEVTPTEKDEQEGVSKIQVNAGPMSVVQVDFGDEKIDKELMQSIISSVERSKAAPVVRGGFPDFGFVIGGLIGCVLWTTFTFGGLTKRFTGFCFVRRDGRNLGVIRSFWRAAILFAPFFLVAYIVSYCNAQGYEYLWWGTQWKRVFCILPLLYLATTFVWYKRTPLDYLSGTVAVPN